MCREKPSALVLCHRRCHCPHPYPQPPWDRGPDLHVVEELSRLLHSLSISFNTVCFILKIILIFKKSGQENGETLNHDKIGLLLVSISHIPPPLLEDFRFLSAPGDLIKLHSALKTSIKYGSTSWRIWVWGISWEFIKIHTQRIPYFFYFTSKEILNFYNLPLKNSIGPQRGDTYIHSCNNLFFNLNKGNLDCKRPHLNTKIFRIQGLRSN